MIKKENIYFILFFYSVNIEAKHVVKDFFIKDEKIITWNGISSTYIQMYYSYQKGFNENDNEKLHVVKDFFIKGEKIITWNGISSTSIQMYNEYCNGFSEKDNEKLKEELNQGNTYYEDTEIRYIKNKYELVRNLLSFSFYCKKQFSQVGFFVFNFNFLDNTNLRQSERIFLEKDRLTYEPGSGRIGILSFLFGIGFYWLKKNNFNISSSFNLGFIWTRENAMQLPNYKQQSGENVKEINYYGCAKVCYDKLKDENKKGIYLVGAHCALKFLPFHYFTWMHGDILFKFEILSIQYKHFYIGCTWKRGIFDTIKVLKNKWWECLPSTISIEIGYMFK